MTAESFTIRFRGVSMSRTADVSCNLLGNASLSRSGGSSASASSGQSGWQLVTRARRKAATEWLTYNPWVMSMQCLLNNGPTLTNESVELACLAIESFEMPVIGSVPPQPPLVVVSGPVPHSDLFWVCSRLEFPNTETAVIRNSDGTRVQQKFSIELTEYSPSSAVSSSSLSPAQRAQLSSGAGVGAVNGSRSYVVKRGDTLQSIAARQLGTVSLWAEIGTLNGLYVGSVLVPGTVLVLPVS